MARVAKFWEIFNRNSQEFMGINRYSLEKPGVNGKKFWLSTSLVSWLKKVKLR